MGTAQLVPSGARAAQPSPAHFFETANAYQRTAALRAAIQLEVFTAIGEGAATAASLAQRCNASERGMRILCDYLVVIGFLTKQGEQYGLTTESATFLDRRSPAYLGTAIGFLNAPMVMERFDDLTAAVRNGGTAMDEEGTIVPENPIWVDFARSMAPMMRPAAEWIAGYVAPQAASRKIKVLDIAAGHGIFGVTVAARVPSAEIVAVDWPNVLDVARENARAHGIDGRYGMRPGDAFKVEYGNGYDFVLITNFFHHWDPPACTELLRKVHAAMADGGRVIALDFVPNGDRVSPPTAAAFGLTMLAGTPRGDVYTFPEYDRMFRNAGFTHTELHALPQAEEQVIVGLK